MFDSKLYSISVCEVTSIHAYCTRLPVYNVFYLLQYMQRFMCMHLCVCACAGVCTRVFIGPCAKRSSNLIAVQRVSTCDSRYIQTLDQYLDRLSDNDLRADMDNCFNMYVFLACVHADLGQGPPSTKRGPKA